MLKADDSWSTGLHGVVTALSRRKSVGFNPRVDRKLKLATAIF
jgi:hypothetical protein